MNPLKILFVSSEVAPFAKTGGLADVSSSLPEALVSLGHQVKVVMPLYRSVEEGDLPLDPLKNTLEVPFQKGSLKAKVFLRKKKRGLWVYFIKRDEFFDRRGLYGTPAGDYFDNPDRFIFFSRAALNLSQLINFQPDIIHCHDWQTALIPVYLRSLYKDDPFYAKSGTVFTIHNLAYQGIFPPRYMEISGLPSELFSIKGLEYYGKMNFMKGGILFSDIITTVSKKYAKEIQTPEYGYGLDGVLRDRRECVLGVLNGVDYSIWNPETDPHIAANYGAENLEGKEKCKHDLMTFFEFKPQHRTPVIGMISRLADQKGLDILSQGIKKLLNFDLYLVLLGTGDEKYEKQFSELGRKQKNRFGVKIAFDNVLAHKIESGADMFLMPSLYEPCGLNQMYSMRYGTIPLVRSTGGLDDTVTEFDPETGEGNGFKFFEYSSQAMLDKIQEALHYYRDDKIWRQLMNNAMKEDFSWKQSALKYEDIYKKIVGSGQNRNKTL
ncbi:MAG: glycogen synthase GlgA [Candidatus Aminicenantes bacterium]|jgi:starch synthase